jgi:hypothetical protein
MKYVILVCLFLSVSFHASAKARVYTNADLKPEQPAKTASQKPSKPPSPPPKGLRPARTAPLFTNKSLEGFEQKNAPAHPGDGNEPNINLTPSGKGNPLAPAGSEQGPIGEPFAGMTVPTLILVAFAFIAWLVSLVDILRSEFTGNNKLVWLVAVTLFPLVGPVLYHFIGRGQKIGPGNLRETA